MCCVGKPGIPQRASSIGHSLSLGIQGESRAIHQASNLHCIRQREWKKEKNRMINVPSVWSVFFLSTHTHKHRIYSHTNSYSHTQEFAHKQTRVHGHTHTSPKGCSLQDSRWKMSELNSWSWLTSMVGWRGYWLKERDSKHSFMNAPSDLMANITAK